MKNRLLCYLAFSHFLGIGPIKFNLLMSHYKDVEKSYGASESHMASLIGAQTAHKFAQFRSVFDAEKTYDAITMKNIEVVSREDDRYPESFRNLSDAPICLYVRGNPEILQIEDMSYFGVVGTRKGTGYGLRATQKLVKDLVEQIENCCIVSGLAYSIDATAHLGALEHGGTTIAFLGCGVDVIYPYGNKQLYERIIKEGGAVVSEFPPGQTVAPGLFIARNRLISGLSRGIVVVEGSKTSGALITARYAAEQGKDVYAVPGPIDSVTSEAPNLLLKAGATVITSVDDVLEAYDLKRRLKLSNEAVLNLSKEEKFLYGYLEHTPHLLDEIVGELKIPVQRALGVLSRLELEGIIERRADEKYTAKAI